MSSSRRNSLSPPTPGKTDKEDTGAHELAEASDSDEHFSDAQSGPDVSHPTSPIPRTRVERVDDKPAYGEVPGTKAYRMREEDATPDEIAFVPDPDSAAAQAAADDEDAEKAPRSPTPGGHPIPTTRVEETPDSAGSVSHPETEKKHRADPPPDLVLKADGELVDNGSAPDTPISPSSLKTPVTARSRRKSSSAMRRSPVTPSFGTGNGDNDVGDDSDDDNDFGEDFDDFEEGGGENDDFDDFEDGFQQADEVSPPATAAAPTPPAPVAPIPPSQPTLSFPIPDFDDLDAPEIYAATEPYLNALFPTDDDDTTTTTTKDNHTNSNNPIFLTPRSASLWSQLAAPPPLQPPDWIRSRIRRLFLVSLGVPVDLDEILPASKQKKLVLPSLHRRASSTGSPRSSSRSRSLSRVRANASTTSVDSHGKAKSPSTAAAAGGGLSLAPSFDLVAAKQLCTTTDEALHGMTDSELRSHIAKLEAMEGTVNEVLVYWQKRTDEKIGDREAFEGVIENLVKHARKVRK
ncbi:hypothetical protein B0T17DRAFT_618844 [Bombardia bombarda]|uniref:Uncharacterized protein n=1 Tax=Bombardia bombarda TaxID=252184 RepID=A0AA39WMZ2_9PEZI|nr:hypothetical protein B0T17DRAFT_618844 [Bombardia bombarda]